MGKLLELPKPAEIVGAITAARQLLQQADNADAALPLIDFYMKLRNLEAFFCVSDFHDPMTGLNAEIHHAIERVKGKNDGKKQAAAKEKCEEKGQQDAAPEADSGPKKKRQRGRPRKSDSKDGPSEAQEGVENSTTTRVISTEEYNKGIREKEAAEKKEREEKDKAMKAALTEDLSDKKSTKKTKTLFVDLKNYPKDPMPHHKNTFKDFFNEQPYYECDKCAADTLVMCVPREPLEGKLTSGYRCQVCGHEETFAITPQDAELLRKDAKLILEVPPGVALKQQEEKKPAKATPAKPPAQGALDLTPEEAPPASIVARAEAGEFDAQEVVADVLSEIPPPPIDDGVMRFELETQIKTWPQEKQLSEWQRVTQGQLPEGDLDGFVQATVLPELVDHFVSKGISI